jgi:hypothetical protein
MEQTYLAKEPDRVDSSLALFLQGRSGASEFPDTFGQRPLRLCPALFSFEGGTITKMNAEELIAQSCHRDIWDDHMAGGLTLAEAVFLAQRNEFIWDSDIACRRWFGIDVPDRILMFMARIYDFMFEPTP